MNFKKGGAHLHSHSHGHIKHKEHLHSHVYMNNEKYLEIGLEKNLNANGPSKKGPKSTKINLNIRGVFLHVLADALGSVAVILSTLLVKYVPSNEKEHQWKFYVDPMLSLLIALFIIISTIPLLKESSLILLQATPHDIDVIQLKEKIINIDHVRKIEIFHVWSLNTETLVASVNLTVSNSTTSINSKVLNQVKSIFKGNNINISSIQITSEIGNAKKENVLFDLSKKEELEEFFPT